MSKNANLRKKHKWAFKKPKLDDARRLRGMHFNDPENIESTRMRMEETLPNYHEDHIAGKGNNPLQHCNLVHKYIPMPQSNEDTRSKRTSGQRMGVTCKDSRVGPDESQK